MPGEIDGHRGETKTGQGTLGGRPVYGGMPGAVDENNQGVSHLTTPPPDGRAIYAYT
jgi:hypothetical protein